MSEHGLGLRAPVYTYCGACGNPLGWRDAPKEFDCDECGAVTTVDDGSGTPWAVANAATGRFECQRCGGTEPFVVDILAMQFADIANGFASRHADCLSSTDPAKGEGDG